MVALPTLISASAPLSTWPTCNPFGNNNRFSPSAYTNKAMLAERFGSY